MTKTAVDSMLGRLARYLRLCGIDATYFNDIEDTFLIAHAIESERVILTRDTLLMNRKEIRNGAVRAMLIIDDSPRTQLRQFWAQAGALGFDLPSKARPRCPGCNSTLRPLRVHEAFGHVPSYIIKTHASFNQCLKCNRIYWQGSHMNHFFKILEELTTL